LSGFSEIVRKAVLANDNADQHASRQADRKDLLYDYGIELVSEKISKGNF